MSAFKCNLHTLVPLHRGGRGSSGDGGGGERGCGGVPGGAGRVEVGHPQAHLGQARGDKHRSVSPARGGVYKLNAVDPELESAWFQPLNL